MGVARTALLFAQAGIQRLCFNGCNGHTLPIHWTKGAHGVAHDDEAFWQTRHPFIVPPLVGAVLIHADGSDRFGLLDGFIQGWLGQAAGIVQKASIIIGWIITQPACQSDYPITALNREDESRSFVVGGVPRTINIFQSVGSWSGQR